jgi:hypothetical protein
VGTTGGNGKPQAVQRVQPSPVNLTVNVRVVDTSAGRRVVLEVFTPTGLSVFFLDAAAAQSIGETLQREAMSAASGLTIARGPLETP